MNLANALTFFRIFISPVFLFFYLKYESLSISFTTLPYILLSLLALSELSDAFDGYFARKFNEVTDFGKIFDPMADSIYRISIFLTFTLPPIQLPIIYIFIFIYRDSLISTLRTICALQGFALAARPSGKLKAVLQGISAILIVLLLIPFSLGMLSEDSMQFLSKVIIALTAAYTVLSALDYLYANRSNLNKLLSARGV
jgi:CDP-diacylglycerol---glycerol-3-phosphate 3-phosphatidyltransferase